MWTNHSNKMKKNMMICLNVVPKHVGDTTYTKTYMSEVNYFLSLTNFWKTNQSHDRFNHIL